jgi:hypothetical protein
MKISIFVTLVLSAACCTAADAPRWLESIQIFATVVESSNAAIIREADAALAPIGFRRDSKGDTYPGGLVEGIFASYSSGDLARAMIVEGSRENCIVFSVTNYDKTKEGLVVASGKAIKEQLMTSFGTKVRLFSDASCKNAL